MNELNYQQQLAEKTETLQKQFADLTDKSFEIYESPASHYRMRAEFRVWHEGEDLFHIMFDKANKQKYRVDQFPTASLLINEAMLKVIELLKPNEVLRKSLFQIDYLSTQKGEILISLLYHKKLDDAWLTAAKQLSETLNQSFPAKIIGRARKQKIVLSSDYVEETLNVFDKKYHYIHVENSFTQPNAAVCEKMLEWAVDCTKNSTGDLLELYCGNGNFSIPLSQNFEKVLATEIAKPSVESAQHNIAANQIENLKILRLSSEEFTQAWNGERTFNRLKDADVDFKNYQLETLFVDPPRSGLDDQTREMAQNFNQLLYISCNPETLHRDLIELTKTYKIERIALFDQFPFTHHAEMGVWLTKN